MTYKEVLEYLLDIELQGMKLGLEKTHKILSTLGNPQKAYPSIHIAGTNGKGSVCSMLRGMMSGAGYKTGLYTSPHLSSVRERFRRQCIF